MMTLLRRFVVLTALMFWQGGFLFYASVVVPVAQTVTSHRQQGFVTQQVTDYLNLSGAVALVPLAWDVFAGRDRSVWRRRGRWALWLGMAVMLALLAWLHPQLDTLLDAEKLRIRDREVFRAGHRWYLWLSTIQWGMGVVFVALMLAAWQREDANEKTHGRGSAG